jgi:hypothetical protein
VRPSRDELAEIDVALFEVAELEPRRREQAYRSRLRFLRIRVGNGRQPTGYTLDGVTVDDHDEPT